MSNTKRQPKSEGAIGIGRPFVVAYTIVYLAAWWPMFLYNYKQWDDLIWRSIPLAQHDLAAFPRPFFPIILAAFDRLQNFLPFMGAPAFVALMLNYAAWLFVCAALLEVRFFHRSQVFWAAMLSAVAPVNISRLMLSTAEYQIALFLFSLGMLFFFFAVGRRRQLFRVVSAVFLFASCQVESFYFATFALLLGVLALEPSWQKAVDWPSAIKKVALLCARYGELVLIPIVSFLTRPSGSGPYADYNALTIKSLVIALPSAFLDALQTIYDLPSSLAIVGHDELGAAFSHIGYYFIIGVIGAICIATVRITTPYFTDHEQKPRPGENVIGILSTFTLLAFLLCPYAAVGHNAWPLIGVQDRNLLTTPLAVGMLLLLVTGFAVKERMRVLVLTVLVVILASSSALGVIGFIRNGQIADGLTAALKKNDQAAKAEALVYGPLELERSFGEPFRYYEMNALLFDAFGDRKRMAVPYDLSNNWPSYLKLLREYPNYGAAENSLVTGKERSITAQWMNFRYQPGVGITLPPLLASAVLWRAWLKITDARRYNTEVGNLVSVSVGPKAAILTQKSMTITP